MQLHRLKLTAIGPFAEPAEVDLDKLSASGIFLLEGPTGAGKSTLIDAIVFALYGEVAGRESSTDRMASAVAAPHLTPSVELDFSTSHGLFRIQRTPKHQRPKRRGSGSTTQHASAKLWRLISPDASEPGEPVSTRIDEIGAEIVDIVGLSREQFVQTVVLPQGEFATFLRADAEHRRALLQRLFGTEIYDRTVERLTEMRRRVRQQRSDAVTVVQGSVRAYGGAAGASRADEEDLIELMQRDADQLLVVVQQQVDTMRAQSSAADAAATAAATVATQARAELVARQNRERSRITLFELRERLVALDATEAQHAEAEERLRLADEAARLMPVLTGLVGAEGRHTKAEAALSAARSALPSSETPMGDWATRERVAREQIVELGPLVECEATFEATATALVQLEAERDEATRQQKQTEKRIAEAPGAIAALREALATASASWGSLAAALDSRQSAQLLLSDAKELVEAEARCAKAAEACEHARLTARQLLDEETLLRSRLIDSMAGVLAAGLVPNTECPVCGSREHPNPATSGDDSVDRASLERASARVTAASEALQLRAAEAGALEANVAELRGRVGSATVETAESVLAEADAAVTKAQAAEADIRRIRGEIESAEGELAQQSGQRDVWSEQVVRLTTTLTAAREALTADQHRVAQSTAGYESVAARVTALTREACAWQAGVAAMGPFEATQDDICVRAAEWDVALAASPFASSDELRAACLDEEQRTELRSLIAMRVKARAECETALNAPEFKDVDPDLPIDVTTASDASEAADLHLQKAQEIRGQLGQRLADSRERAAEVQTSLAAQRTVMASTESVIRMADLASASTSDNARAMSLPTYVLRERFVDVVSSANERLATMSDGRYRLEHVEDRRGNRRSGLELQVRDTHTEHPRDPATLSGGESFYCSLALALGLADVVTTEAGGVDLGTLFVDEGFGSLDPDTLDQVLEVLNALATSGRAVGIVSHVPELKEQIAERVSVIPNRDGSSRLVVAA